MKVAMAASYVLVTIALSYVLHSVDNGMAGFGLLATACVRARMNNSMCVKEDGK